jgi:hypothetical protein
MPKLSVSQVRSGEGWILTRLSNVGPEILAGPMADLLTGPLLIASEAFETWTPPGGEQLEAHLVAFRGDAAKAMLRDASRWGADRAIIACLPRLPDADARRKWLPDVLRPWDPDRLKATFYGQVGKGHAIRGLWVASDRDRARYVEASIEKILGEAGLKLPAGDATIVLEMPTDSTFEGEYAHSGRGASFSLSRAFPSQMVSRRWTIERGEWRGEQTRIRRASELGLRVRAIRFVATAGIFILSIPVFALVALVALITRFSGTTTSVSKSTPPRALR